VTSFVSGVDVGVEREQAWLVRLDGGIDVVGKPGFELLQLARLHLVGADEDEWCRHGGLLAVSTPRFEVTESRLLAGSNLHIGIAAIPVPCKLGTSTQVPDL
jgi:hypothetical protein